ncbi:phosphatidylinositol-specific phospholipase C domain-containing protein [Kitasatospora sp. NPDC002040]|uniref:phosphatidylinositol-specific phospholipase C domain-containing protein n=1 Tax=Kitasatospora sp. NPDC002040 TaxID=3154661 RepID=UPI00332EBEAE
MHLSPSAPARRAGAVLRRSLRRLTRAAAVAVVTTAALLPLSVPGTAHASGTDNRDAYRNLGDAPLGDWMSQLGPNTPLTAMSIPGTHETLSLHGGNAVQTQQDFGDSAATLRAQLDRGIRAIDIRVRVIGGTFTIHHGTFYQTANFEDVLKKAQSFLGAHPGETVVMRLKAECNGSTGSCTDEPASVDQTVRQQIFDNYVATFPGLFYNDGRRTDPPTLGQARGKIVLGFFNGPGGGDYSGYGLNGFEAHTQDTWNAADAPTKWNLVKKNLDAAVAGSTKQTFVTYTSASNAPLGYGPDEIAGGTSVLRGKELVWVPGVNERLMDYFNSGGGKGRLGIVMMDFPGWAPVYDLIMRNQDLKSREGDPAIWRVRADKSYADTKYGRCMVRGPEFDDNADGGLVTQRACQATAPSSHQWTATDPKDSFDGKGYYWLKAANGKCLTVPYNNGTPPGAGTQLFWWPCETRWFSGSQMWNVIPTPLPDGTGYKFINYWTGLCLMVDPSTAAQSGGKVVQGSCPR